MFILSFGMTRRIRLYRDYTAFGLPEIIGIRIVSHYSRACHCFEQWWLWFVIPAALMAGMMRACCVLGMSRATLHLPIPGVRRLFFELKTVDPLHLLIHLLFRTSRVSNRFCEKYCLTISFFQCSVETHSLTIFLLFRRDRISIHLVFLDSVCCIF